MMNEKAEHGNCREKEKKRLNHEKRLRAIAHPRLQKDEEESEWRW